MQIPPIWGVLLKSESPFAKLDVIRPDDLLQMPLILHRRAGLQQDIADWAQTDVEHLHITATYNIVHGSPATFVQNDIGCFLTTHDQLPPEPYNGVTFRPLEPKLEVRYNLVWKRRNVFSRAASLFLENVRQSIMA